MGTPPPLNPKPAPQRQPESSAPKSGQSVNRGSNSNKKWLIAGCCLAGILLIAALLLFLLTDLFDKGGYDYDDGNRNEKVLRSRDNDVEELEKAIPRAEAAADSLPVYAPVNVGAFHGQGMNGSGTFMLDIECDSNGKVSGKYCNILYCLNFDVSGVQTSDGTLELKLVQSKDGTPTYLTLYTTNGSDYTGTWGKSSKPVNVTLYTGPVSPQAAPNVLQRWHIKGPDNQSILNQDVNISQDSNGTYFFWYPSLGYAARFRLDAGTQHSELYNYAGKRVAEISNYNDIGVGSTATLIDNEGQRFELTRYE